MVFGPTVISALGPFPWTTAPCSFLLSQHGQSMDPGHAEAISIQPVRETFLYWTRVTLPMHVVGAVIAYRSMVMMLDWLLGHLAVQYHEIQAR